MGQMITLSTMFLMLVALVPTFECYSMGAPDAACNAMTPGHSLEPQKSPVPGNLTTSGSWVQPGEMLGIELAAGQEGRFKGFIIQARNAAAKDSQVGSFVVSGDEASYMTCGRGIHNSITHRTNALKEKIAAQWRAPFDFEGEVVFRFTFLSEYSTYWVGVDTAKVRVSRSAKEEVVAKEEKIAKEEEVAGEENFVKDEVEDVPLLKPSIKADDSDAANAIQVEPQKEVSEEVKKAEEIEVIKPNSVAEDNIETVENYTPVYISSTTTLRTTTTTTEAPREPLPVINGVQQLTDPYDPIYDGCSSSTNSSKACFGMPQGCEKTRKCQVVASYAPEKLNYVFEMKGLSNGYISLGLSRDARMGEDLTTSCLIQGNGQVDIVSGYNKGYSGNKNIPRKDKKDGIEERMKNSVRDGWISCSWKRRREVTVEGQDWNLGREKFHIMLAQGTVTEGRLVKHRAKVISGDSRGLGEPGLVQAKSKLFIILHGSFMIGAWVCAASLGIMIARYYKQTWTSTRCCNLDQWFVWHRTLMMLAWCLTIAAFVLILLEIKGVSKTLNTNPHALIGFITVGLCFLQPFLALVRPAPSARYRGIFNWVHWLIGNCAQILGIVCIFYAVDLDKAQLPRPETDWLLVGFVGFHFLAHLLLAALSCCSESSSSKAGYPLAMRPLARNSGPYPDYEELKRDQPGSAVRTFVLVVYGLVNIIVTAALILLVVMAPTRQQLVEFGILPTVPATI